MSSRRRIDFAGLLARLTRALEKKDLPFMLVGGQAVLLHGEPRLTEDIDVTLGIAPGRVGELLEVVDAMDLSVLPDDAKDFVEETFVLPVEEPQSGVRIDFIFSVTPYEAEAIGRAVPVEIEDEAVPFATAEDLILHKLFTGRPRDLEDAAGVIRRKGDELDWEELGRWAEEFASIPGRGDLPEQLDELRAILE